MINVSRNFGYVELPHPADVALKFWGDNFLHFYKAALEGLYHLSGMEVDECYQSISVSLNIPCEQMEMTLVNFLNEVIFMLEGGHAFLISYLIREKDCIWFHGEQKPVRKLNRSVKAATFSELQIRKNANYFEAVIVFDV